MSPRLRHALWLASAVAAVGCVSSTESGQPLIDMRGSWNYHGTQDSPAATLEGTLSINQQRGNQFTGSWSVIENTAGSQQSLTGVVSGQVLDTAHVDFDVQVGSETRRHVARVASDSADGVWTEFSGGASGSFSAGKAP